MPFAGALSGRYAYNEVVEGWSLLVVATNELEARLRTSGRPVAADMLLRAYGAFRDDLLVLARKAAAFGTEELRRSERETRVRPDSLGDGGPRLGDSLVTERLPQTLLPGGIGVADEELLDNNVPWWITNEIGNSTNIGRRIYGFFHGDGDMAPPSPMFDRMHPLFQPGVGPESGLGVINEPIPERRFILKAIPKIDAFWQEGFQTARGAFDAQLAIVLGTPR